MVGLRKRLSRRRRQQRAQRQSGLSPSSFNTQSTTPGGTKVNQGRGGTLTAAPASLQAPTGTTASTARIAAPAAQQRPLGAQAPNLGPSLDVPPALQALIKGGNLPMINMAAVNRPIPTGTGTTNKAVPALDYRFQPYAFEEGGMVGPGGMPVQQGMPQPMNKAPLSPEQMDGEMARTVQNNPEAIQSLAAELQNAIQTGELQADQVNMGLQLAQSAVQDPSLYPQLREFALNNGLAEQDDLPMEYDEGLAFIIILACKLALGMPVPGMGQPMEQGMPSMRSGGALPKESPNPGGGIPIMAHEGEYVIPKEVVARKGTEFFDKLIQANNGSKVS
tara:strand:+ start:408 stop:1409 length:1002 start_codon:yes stop_codon:yes gene_type:complete